MINKSNIKYCSDKCRSKNNYNNLIKKLKSNPILYEKYLLKRRNEKRLKKGIDINLARLLACKGSGNTNSKGYRRIYVKGHPNSQQKGSSRGMIFEHIFIMSNFLGRALKFGENVHHINGIKNDNRLENLELWTRSQPFGSRVEDKIKWAKEFLENYGYLVILQNPLS